jgi:hypothetical protein
MLLAFTFAGATVPLLAADLRAPREAYPDNDRPLSGGALTQRKVAEFCDRQRQICRKVCNLRSRFEDRFDGCPHSCDARETRCMSTACYRWTDPDFIIAEKFGGYKCAL